MSRSVPALELNLDELWSDGYFYTKYDVAGCGHEIVIAASDKEAFLDAFAAEFRRRAEALLRESDYEVDEEE